jgi:uncharacterized protein YqgQ
MGLGEQFQIAKHRDEIEEKAKRELLEKEAARVRQVLERRNTMMKQAAERTKDIPSVFDHRLRQVVFMFLEVTDLYSKVAKLSHKDRTALS